MGGELLKFEFHFGEEGFDLRLNVLGVSFRTVDDSEFFEERERAKQRDSVFRKLEAAEFQQFEVFHAGEEFEVLVCRAFAVREGEALEGGDGFDEGKRLGFIEALAELQEFKGQRSDVSQCSGRRVGP